MPKARVALTLDASLVDRVDTLVPEQRYRNRSQAVEAALSERLDRLAGIRLATECRKLDPAVKQHRAEEGLTADSCPEY